jgi:pteridine reductase
MCTLTLAKEFAPYVRINGVAPGAILWAEEWEDASGATAENELKNKESLKKIPLGRKGDPKHVASTVEFLVRDAGFITGQVMNVDGGRTLHQ